MHKMALVWSLALFMVLLLTPSRAWSTENRLLFPNSDFEHGDLTNWQADGDAFRFQPTLGDNPAARGWKQKAGLQGKYWIATYEKYNGKTAKRRGMLQTDRPQGTLTSVPFLITYSRITFLAGGGKKMEQLYVALVVDGKEVRRATGTGKTTMRRVSWEVKEFAGREGRIIIADHDSRGWGHINADDFRFAGQRLVAVEQHSGAVSQDETPAPASAGEPTPVAPPVAPVAGGDGYDGWFPAPLAGWSASPAIAHDLGNQRGQIIEVSKVYIRKSDQAKMRISVIGARFAGGEGEAEGDLDADTLKRLAKLSGGEYFEQNGYGGILVAENGESNLKFVLCGMALTIDLSLKLADNGAVKSYGHRLDIRAAKKLFLEKKK